MQEYLLVEGWRAETLRDASGITQKDIFLVSRRETPVSIPEITTVCYSSLNLAPLFATSIF